MDEGLNSYMQYLTQELWDNKFPSNGGPAWSITDYMKLPKEQLEPIMTNSENINNFGANAYSKVATGLNILRETIVRSVNYLTMLSVSMQNVGLSNIPHRLTCSEHWKMQQVKTLIGSGEAGSMAQMLAIFQLTLSNMQKQM
jgi:hypothetical protein